MNPQRTACRPGQQNSPRFPPDPEKGFHKGIELYGAIVDRLKDRRLKESLGKQGLFVVEGQNDVIRLDTLGLPAVALCSNKATETQIDKLDRLARTASQSRLILMPDNDEEGEASFKDLLWRLASRDLDVRLAWSRTSHGGKFAGMQPEEIDDCICQNMDCGIFTTGEGQPRFD